MSWNSLDNFKKRNNKYRETEIFRATFFYAVEGYQKILRIGTYFTHRNFLRCRQQMEVCMSGIEIAIYGR